MDETGVMLSMLGSVKVLVGKDDTRDYRGARVKRTTVTAIECISAEGKALDPMIIWPASTHRSNWTTFPTPGWHYACSESGYTDAKISLEWLKRVFDPQTKDRANRQPRVLICDGFGAHETLGVLEFCFENSIILCRLPSHTSHKLQPCDIAVFGPLKAGYRDEIERLERERASAAGKEHFTSLYSPARERALTRRNVFAGWAKSGLFPFNRDRVLRNIPKPVAVLTTPQACELDVGSCPQGQVVRTPVTPVTIEALTSLQDLTTQDAHALDESSRQRLQRRLQKLSNAAQTSFAERALQQDQIRFLSEVNNEARVRRSTKPVVLGKAKVMSYGDLVEARVKRAVKDAAKARGKGKCGRKRKSPASRADAPESNARMARMSEAAESVRPLVP